MTETFSAKKFKEFISNERKRFLENCMKTQNTTENTKEDLYLADSYFPSVNSLKNYGYYHYNHHTKLYQWSKTK